MTSSNIILARRQFDAAIAVATSSATVFTALQDFVRAIAGAKLFTVTTVDMEAELVRRIYTSDPQNYPVSGTKPIEYNRWFDQVHKERKIFVSNTIEDIATVFFDHELIKSLGCRSVVNLPLVIKNELVGTVNMLDVENYYTPERVLLIEQEIPVPAKLALLLARMF